MKPWIKPLLAGVAVLALVLIGALGGRWLEQGGGLAGLADSPTGESLPLYIEADCDIAVGRCRFSDVPAPPPNAAQIGDSVLAASFAVGPQPNAMTEFPISLKLESGSAPLTAVEVSFSMQGMSMGLNRYRLQQTPAGDWVGSARLPICASGRRDWLAQLTISTLEGRRYSGQFGFVVE